MCDIENFFTQSPKVQNTNYLQPLKNKAKNVHHITLAT